MEENTQEQQALTPQTVSTKTKILSLLPFILVLTALAVAIIFDIVVFGGVILNFFIAIFISVLAFIIAFIGMVISIFLVFGIYLLGEHGFWPFNFAITVFKDIVGSYEIDPNLIKILLIVRIILLVVCVISLILSIISLRGFKRGKKAIPPIGGKKWKAFAKIAFILAILGMAVQTFFILFITLL